MRTSVTTAPFYPRSAGLLAREFDGARVEHLEPPLPRDAAPRLAAVEERQVGLEDALAVRRARGLVEQRVEALHLADEGGYVVAAPGLAGRLRLGPALLRMIDGVDDGARQRPGVVR